MYDEQPEAADMPHTFWNCEACGAENSCIDAECQMCECEGYGCKRRDCSGESHPWPCEKCGQTRRLEEIPLHGITQSLCEPCARHEAPYMFPVSP